MSEESNSVEIDHCLGCQASEDRRIETVQLIRHRLDSYIVLIVGCTLSVLSGTVGHLFALGDYDPVVRICEAAAFLMGGAYYVVRNSSVAYPMLFCDGCRKKLLHRDFNRMAVKVLLPILAIGGAMAVSAIMRSDDYIDVPVILAGMLGAIAWYFKVFARPKFVAIGKESSIVSIPDIGVYQLRNPD